MISCPQIITHLCHAHYSDSHYIHFSKTPKFVTHCLLWLLGNKVRTLGKGLKSLSIWIKLSCRQWGWVLPKHSMKWGAGQLPPCVCSGCEKGSCNLQWGRSRKCQIPTAAVCIDLGKLAAGVSLTLRNPHFTFPRALSCKAWGAAIGLTTIFCWNKWKACFVFHLGSVL